MMPASSFPCALPPQVEHLPAREREVALLIYVDGPKTAKALESSLNRDLSNSALRSMLGRLCRKGILSRRKLAGSHHEADRRIPFVYAPALTPVDVRRSAIQRFAEEYFAGSVLMVAREAIALLGDEASSKHSAGLRSNIDLAA